MKTSFLKKLLCIAGSIFLIAFFIKIPLLHADTSAGYQFLAPLQNGQGTTITNPDLATYIKGMYSLLISLSAVIAVVMIIYGGILYMSTDAISQKKNGKAIITRTLWGLLLIIGSYVILVSINPTILNLSFLPSGSSTASPSPSPSSGGLPDGSDCSQGSVCASGTCDTSQNKCSQALANYSYCEEDKNCVSTHCVAHSCSPGLAVGTSCKVSGDCLSNLCVNKTCQNSLAADNAGCNNSTDCISQNCINGICQSTNLPDNSYCTTPQQCTNGNCINYTCTSINLGYGAKCKTSNQCSTGDCVNEQCLNINTPSGGRCLQPFECTSHNCISGKCQ